jgi:hypothetical protein
MVDWQTLNVRKRRNGVLTNTFMCGKQEKQSLQAVETISHINRGTGASLVPVTIKHLHHKEQRNAAHLHFLPHIYIYKSLLLGGWSACFHKHKYVATSLYIPCIHYSERDPGQRVYVYGHVCHPLTKTPLHWGTWETRTVFSHVTVTGMVRTFHEHIQREKHTLFSHM